MARAQALVAARLHHGQKLAAEGDEAAAAQAPQAHDPHAHHHHHHKRLSIEHVLSVAADGATALVDNGQVRSR